MTTTVTDYELIQHLDFEPVEVKNCTLRHGEATCVMVLNPCQEDDGIDEALGCVDCVREFDSKPPTETWKITFIPSGRTRTYGTERNIINKVRSL